MEATWAMVCVVCGGDGYAYMRWAMDGVADLGVSGCGPVVIGRQRENEIEAAYQDGVMAVALWQLRETNSNGNSFRTLRLNKLMQRAFSVMNLRADDDTTVEIVENNMDNIIHQVRKYKSTLLGKNTVDDDDENILLEISSTPMLDLP
ncbi:unnamed protein product [Ilex paraguariensis]|uniref:Uncharacterized protein n=1 Tax=Ilex paraguariensis TaxID=185542 RepID=A0ABC8QYH2_9AQUA